MKDIKISSLGVLDEQKFKKMDSSRISWLEDGTDMIINPNTKTKELVDEIMPNLVNVVVKKILKETDRCKTLIIEEVNGKKLPPFRAGQKVALIINIDGNFYTRPFTIACSNKDLSSYRIAVFKNEEDTVMNYLYSKLKVGEKFSVSKPFGDFYYDPIRDEENIVMIVSGYGVAAALAMAEAVNDEMDKTKLTIFYSEKKDEDMAYKDELIRLADNPKIRVGFILSEEKKEETLEGFASLDKVQSEMVEGHTSIFISGPEGLLKYLEKELAPLNLPKKFIRYDNFLPVCNIKRIAKYNLTIYINKEKYEVPCFNNKTILTALEESGVYIPSKCHNGSCGLCRSELVKGEVKVINDKRVEAEKKYNIIHPCCTYPLGDIEIVVR